MVVHSEDRYLHPHAPSRRISYADDIPLLPKIRPTIRLYPQLSPLAFTSPVGAGVGSSTSVTPGMTVPGPYRYMAFQGR